MATSLTTGACHCGEEQRVISISSALDSLSIIGDGVTQRIASIGRVDEMTSPPSSFDFVFNTLEGSTSGDGIVLSLSGYDPKTPNDIVILSLAVPASLRRGNEHSVDRTFSVDATIDGDPRAFGSYDLLRSDQAEAAFTMATYSFPPSLFTTTFRATQSTGTIRVTEREDGRVELAFTLTFTDGAGKTKMVTGHLRASTQRSYPPCTS